MEDLKLIIEENSVEKCDFLWDERWIISAKNANFLRNAKVGRVKNQATLKNLRESCHAIKYSTVAQLPAVFCEDKIIAMPGLVESDSITFQVAYSKETFIKRLENGQ